MSKNVEKTKLSLNADVIFADSIIEFNSNANISKLHLGTDINDDIEHTATLVMSTKSMMTMVFTLAKALNSDKAKKAYADDLRKFISDLEKTLKDEEKAP